MDNLRGILLMVAAMAGFAVEDALIKAAATEVPTGQILVALGLGGATVFGVWARARGERLFAPAMFAAPMLLRNGAEVIGSVCFVTAITLVPLATIAAILQATPLAVTLGAALFLGAPVGWRRWMAILIGLGGVLLILRPGMAEFQPAALFAVVTVVALAIRDLGTRVAPAAVSSIVISSWGFAMVALAGLVLLPLGGGPVAPSPPAWAMLAGALAFGCAAYYAITAAMRVGEVAVVTPFRYTRLLFAMILGLVIFGERPDGWTLVGAAIIIASGLYTLARERRLARAARAPHAAAPASGLSTPPPAR